MSNEVNTAICASISAALTLLASAATTPLTKVSPVRPNKYLRTIRPSVNASILPLSSMSSRLPKPVIRDSISVASV